MILLARRSNRRSAGSEHFFVVAHSDSILTDFIRKKNGGGLRLSCRWVLRSI